MACSIEYNKNTGKVENVFAPNGQPSLLYRNAINRLDNADDALRVWATAYTQIFKDAFGDWENESTTVPLDENGEPDIDMVMHTNYKYRPMLVKSYESTKLYMPSSPNELVLEDKANEFKKRFEATNPDVTVELDKDVNNVGRVKMRFISQTKAKEEDFSKKEIENQKAIVNNILDKLVSKFEGASYEWIKPSDLNQEDHYEPVENVKAFVRNNKIYLVEGRVKPTDAIEEVAHIVIESLRQNKPALFKGLLDAAKADPTYGNDYENIKNWYNKKGTATPIVINSEFLAKHLTTAIENEVRNNPQGRPTSRFGKLVERFLEWLQSILGLKNMNPTAFSRMTMNEIAGFINTTGSQMEIPTLDYLYYSLSEDQSGKDPMDDKDEIDHIVYSKYKTSTEKNKERCENAINKIDLIIERANAEVIRSMEEELRVKSLEKIKLNLQQSINIFDNNLETISASKYLGSENIEIINPEIAEAGAKTGTFFHEALDQLQSEFIRRNSTAFSKTPLNILITENDWFDNYLEKVIEPATKKHPEIKAKDLLVISGLTPQAAKEIFIDIVAQMQKSIIEGDILIPELPMTATDLNGRIILSRLDYIAIKKTGKVEIYDLKTNLIEGSTTSSEIIGSLNSSKSYGGQWKEGVDKELGKIRNRSKIDKFNMQTSLYGETMDQAGLEVQGRHILYVGIGTTKTPGGTKLFAGKHVLASLSDADFHSYRYAGLEIQNDKANAIETAIRSRFKTPEQLTPQTEDTTKKDNPFALFTDEEKQKLTDALVKAADDQISKLEKDIEKISQLGLSKEEENSRKDPINRRIGTIRIIKEQLTNSAIGEDRERDQAILIKIALDTFDHELDSLIDEVKQLEIPSVVDLVNDQHQNILKTIFDKNAVADGIIVCVNSLISVVENSDVDASIKNNIKEMLGKLTIKATTNVKTPFNKLNRAVVKAIIRKEIGQNKLDENQFTKVMAQNKERLEPIIDKLKREITEIETGVSSGKENILSKGTRILGNLVTGKNNQAESLQDKKDKLKHLEALVAMDKLDDTVIDQYLDGIFNPGGSDFYIGQTMSARRDMPIDLDSLIASGLNPEMLINAVWQLLYTAQEEATREFLNEVYKNKTNSYVRETADKVGGIERLNEELTEMIDEDGETHQYFADVHAKAYKDKIDNFEQTRIDLKEKLKTLEKEKQLIDKTDTAAVDAKDAEIKQTKEDQINNENAYTEWLIKYANTKLKPEAMRAQRAGGQLNHDIAALLNEQSKLILSKGTDRETGYANLTQEDIDVLEQLELKINAKREELRQQDPAAYEQLKEYLSYFEFVPNWNYFEKIKLSMKETYGENSNEYKNWLKRSTDKVPTKQWRDAISDLYDQLAELGTDPALKSVLDRQKEIKKKYMTFGKFNPSWMSDEDVEEYTQLEEKRDEIIAKLREEEQSNIENETGDPDDHIKIIKRREIFRKLGNISTKEASEFYTKKRDDLIEKVLLHYREILRLEKELANVDLTNEQRTDLQNQKISAENQYMLFEQKFKEFFDKNNYTTYTFGTIAKNIDLGENYKPFVQVTVPSKEEYFETVPNKRFRIKRLKDEAINPDYQESFEPKKVGNGFYPMMKGVKFNKETNEFDIDAANIPTYTDENGNTKNYVNPKFLRIKNDPTLNEFYKEMVVKNFLVKQKSAFGKPLGFHVPFTDAGTAENIRFKGAKGVADEIKQKVQEAALPNSEFEKAYNEYGMAGAEKTKFPSNYRMNAQLNSRDGVGSILNWNKDYYVNRKMAEASLYTQSTKAFLENLKNEIVAREGNKDIKSTNDKVSQIDNIRQIVEFEEKKFVYGQLYEKSKSGSKVFNRKTAKLMMSVASVSRMAGDIPMQIGNLLAGNVQAFLSTCETRHATKSDYFWAKGWIYSEFFPKVVSDWGKPLDQVSKETKMYRYWNPSSKNLHKQLDMNTASKSRRAVNKLMDPLDLLMAGQDKGEFEIGSTTWAMILHHRNYFLYETDAQGNVVMENEMPKIKLNANGEKMTVNGLEILEEMPDGSMQLRKDVAVTQEEVNSLQRLVTLEITRFQGNYATETMSKFGGTLIGSLYNFYRKYLFPAVSARFSGLGNLDGYEGIGTPYSWSTEEAYRGWYTVLFNMFQVYDTSEAFKAMALGVIPSALREKLGLTTKVNSYYMSRAAMASREVLAAVLFYMMYEVIRSIVMSSDDDDLSYAELVLLKSLVKVSNESRSLVPAPVVGKTADYIDNFGQFTNAFKEGKTFVQLMDHSLFYLMYHTTGSDFAYERGFYQRKAGRYEKGDAKVFKNLSDLSGWSNIVGSFNPYLELKQSVTQK